MQHGSAGAAAWIVALLVSRGESVATAESLTGGLLCARLVDGAGASEAVCGGVVAYNPAMKTEMLGVDASLLTERGTVNADVARQMAEGARDRLGATWGISTTGEAGPDPAEDKPVGTVFVGVAGPTGSSAHEFSLFGSRSHIRHSTVSEALSCLLDTLQEQSAQERG